MNAQPVDNNLNGGKQVSLFNKSRRARSVGIAVAGIACLSIAATACSSNSTPASGGGGTTPAPREGGASEDDLAYVASVIEKYKSVPEFVAPGPAFDASKAKGKHLFLIGASSSVPFVQNMADAVGKAAASQGVEFTDWKNEGQSSQHVQGMDSAIQQGANSIDLLAGVNPGALAPQIAEAKSRGISTVVSHLWDDSQLSEGEKAGVDAIVPFPYVQAGKLLANWVIHETQGDTHTIVLTANESLSSAPMMDAIESEYTERCGESCKLTQLNFGIVDAPAQIQPQLQSALTANPDANYVIALFDSLMAPYAVAAIRGAGKVGQVHVATYNGTPEILQEIGEDSVVAMDVGESLDWAGYAILDQHMRLMTGEPPLDTQNLPLRIFDKTNVQEALAAGGDGGYGRAFEEGYAKLWGN